MNLAKSPVEMGKTPGDWKKTRIVSFKGKKRQAGHPACLLNPGTGYGAVALIVMPELLGPTVIGADGVNVNPSFVTTSVYVPGFRFPAVNVPFVAVYTVRTVVVPCFTCTIAEGIGPVFAGIFPLLSTVPLMAK